MNNADLTVKSLRDLQAYTLERTTSPDDIVKKIEFSIARANEASKETNRYNDQINRIINALQSKGLFNGDIIAAFTGLSLEKAKELENDLEKAKKEILK